jgi:hypothetical protein
MRAGEERLNASAMTLTITLGAKDLPVFPKANQAAPLTGRAATASATASIAAATTEPKE